MRTERTKYEWVRVHGLRLSEGVNQTHQPEDALHAGPNHTWCGIAAKRARVTERAFYCDNALLLCIVLAPGSGPMNAVSVYS